MSTQGLHQWPQGTKIFKGAAVKKQQVTGQALLPKFWNSSYAHTRTHTAQVVQDGSGWRCSCNRRLKQQRTTLRGETS